jgi:hypothetical protein
VWVKRDGFIRSVDRATLEFLRAVKRVAPEVLSSLGKDVLPLYQSIYSSETAFEREYLLTHFPSEVTYGLGLGRIPIASMQDEFLMDGSGGVFLMLRCAVYRWAKHFHLNGLVLACAVETLRAWSQAGTTRHFDWEYQLEHPVIVDPTLEFHFEYPEWQPNSDSWSSYQKKLDEALSCAKREYKHVMVSIANGIKGSRAVDKRESSRHFDWLVHFQVKERDYKDIYEQYRQDCNLESLRAVQKAVGEAAKLVGLPLRATGRRRGRPSKH